MHCALWPASSRIFRTDNLSPGTRSTGTRNASNMQRCLMLCGSSPLRDELRQSGLPGSIGCLHAAECLGRDMDRFRRGGMMDFPTKRCRTDPDATHDHADGEGFLG